jgi:hypothetical protein
MELYGTIFFPSAKLLYEIQIIIDESIDDCTINPGSRDIFLLISDGRRIMIDGGGKTLTYDSPKCPGNDVDSTRKAILGGKRKRKRGGGGVA